MKMIKLQDLAQIEISNVDKKSIEGETSVKLCNFVDVYYNWAITAEMTSQLMDATAKENQIAKFTLRKGQVAITKDSETRDDIGVATYIADDIPGVILGYHCVLITPNENLINGKYLNVIFHSPYAQKYFEANASGSGQRYTLTNEIVGEFPIPVIEIEKQKQIGDLFSNIDRKIANNRVICADLESMAKLLYDYWFVQFDFPDENGKPYKSSGGKMVWNEELKREIPEEWTAQPLSVFSKIVTDSLTPQSGSMYYHYSIPAFDDCGLPAMESGEEINSNKYRVPKHSVLVSKLNPQFKRLWLVENPQENAVCSTEFMPFVSTKNQEAFLYSVLNSDSFYRYMVQSSSSSTGSRKRMEPGLCLEFTIAYPNKDDIISRFCEKVRPILIKICESRYESSDLGSLRDFLLPMLMNGQVKVSHKE